MDALIQVINPFNRKPLRLTPEGYRDDEGILFPMRGGASRFAAGETYADSFGFQWNKFERTQIDRFQKSSAQSRDRLLAVTGWDKEDLSGMNILEVGSGAGRFTQVVLQFTKGNLFSIDYSNAVEANFRNNGHNDRLHLFQASVYDLPFAPGQFDKVFCFGVLQHTPDFKRSIHQLISMVKPGGELIVDFYPVRGWYTKVHAKYFLRPLTRRMNHTRLLGTIEKYANPLIAIYSFFESIGLGRILNRFLPVCDIKRTIPHQLDPATRREWVILDTFDMFSPVHDHPQRLSTVVDWFKEFGMEGVTGQAIPYGEGNEVTAVRGFAPDKISVKSFV